MTTNEVPEWLKKKPTGRKFYDFDEFDALLRDRGIIIKDWGHPNMAAWGSDFKEFISMFKFGVTKFDVDDADYLGEQKTEMAIDLIHFLTKLMLQRGLELSKIKHIHAESFKQSYPLRDRVGEVVRVDGNAQMVEKNFTTQVILPMQLLVEIKGKLPKFNSPGIEGLFAIGKQMDKEIGLEQELEKLREGQDAEEAHSNQDNDSGDGVRP